MTVSELLRTAGLVGCSLVFTCSCLVKVLQSKSTAEPVTWPFLLLCSSVQILITSDFFWRWKENLEACMQDLHKLHNIFSSLLNPPPALPACWRLTPFMMRRLNISARPSLLPLLPLYYTAISLLLYWHIFQPWRDLTSHPVLQFYHLPGSKPFYNAPNHLIRLPALCHYNHQWFYNIWACTNYL